MLTGGTRGELGVSNKLRPRFTQIMNVKGIFSRESNAHDQLVALRSADQAAAIFEELSVALAEKGVSLVGIVSVSREQSIAASATTHASEPCLSLFLSGSSYQESGLNPEDSNWSGHWTHTAFVREQWARLCSQYQVPMQYHSSAMFVFVYDTRHLDLVRLVQTCKPLMGRILSARFKSASPLRAIFGADASTTPCVFVSSEPSISIVFPTNAALKRARVSGDLKRTRDSILAVLERNDRYDCFSEAAVGIRFLDAETSADELYGLARED
jgi:hypothetical protein